MIKNLISKKIISNCIAFLLVLTFIATPVSHTLTVNRVSADADDAANILSLPQNIWTAVKTAWTGVSAASSAASDASVATKEITLDGIAWAIGNVALEQMIRGVTKWVNSGFKGNPAFVTDLKGFMTDVADKVAGNFIWGNKELRFLCSPFALNIKLALDIQYRATRDYEAQCTITGIVQNTERFLGGDFLAGGWNGWYEITMNPQNNPYGAMLAAQDAMYAGINQAKEIDRDRLGFGNGFMSVEHCFSEGDDERCETVTPGVVVQDQLNRALGQGSDRLTVADEINELMGALFAQLAGQALSGAGGLLGLTEPEYGGGNYFDQISAQQASIGYSNSSNEPIARSIAEETTYLNFQREIVSLIQDASNYKNSQYPDIIREDDDGTTRVISQCSAGALTPSLSRKLSEAQRSVASSTSIIQTLTNYKNDYEVLTSSTTQTSLDLLLTKYNAQSTPEAQGNLMNRYLSYQSSGALHTSGDVVTLELTSIPQIKEEIVEFKRVVDEDCNPDRDNGGSSD